MVSSWTPGTRYGSKGEEEHNAVMDLLSRLFGPSPDQRSPVPRVVLLIGSRIRQLIKGEKAGNSINKLQKTVFSVHETWKYTLRGHGK